MRIRVSTHSRLKAAGFGKFINISFVSVSTHSRLKAAGAVLWAWAYLPAGFNTQPPEGGWLKPTRLPTLKAICFNTQPPEGGWELQAQLANLKEQFQHTAA